MRTRSRRYKPTTILRYFRKGSWRVQILSAVSAWNRNQFRRIALAILVTWVVGALGLHLTEGTPTSNYPTWWAALWKSWVILFSGINNPPTTVLGQLFTMLLLTSGVALTGLFTASVASVMVERYLRRREVTKFEMEDHLVLCNWSPRGLEWIREVHSKIVRERRAVVIIHDTPEQIELPDTQDDEAFTDVYIVKGDPVNEVILRRARVHLAHSVVVLSDERLRDHADGKTILVCIAVRSVCGTANRPNLAVECLHPRFRQHLRKAGADEVISAHELGLRLLARASLFHGMTRVYQELLTVGRDANEVYLLPVPADLVGKDFVTVSTLFLHHRHDKRACLLIGIQRGELMMLNPVAGEAGPIREGDELILLSQVYPDPAKPLPIESPQRPTPEGPSVPKT